MVSINDIAKALGISASTVSRALKSHPDISLETRELVKAYAAKVNYRPNALALSLKRQRSQTIGLIIPEIVHHFFSSVISGIEELAYSKGYRLIICQSNEDEARERINLQALIDHRVDGILVSVSKHTEKFDHFEEAIREGIPIVLFDRAADMINADKVLVDDYEGGLLAVNHLVSRGRKRIMHLAAPEAMSVGRQRRKGFIDGLKSHGMESNRDLIITCDSREGVLANKDSILQFASQIDGIFAVNDNTAISVIQLLTSHGYKIPEDISVVGFGNDPIASLVSPRLTTVDQQGFTLGRQAVEVLIHRLERPSVAGSHQTRVIGVNLQVRESS